MKMLLKLKLLDLASKLQKAGIEEAFNDVQFDDQFTKTWNKFWRSKKNRHLKRKIQIWGEDFVLLKPGKLFTRSELLSNPLEIAAIIYLINDEKVSENELFEDRNDLVWAIDRIYTDFAETIAETIRNQSILDVDCLAVF